MRPREAALPRLSVCIIAKDEEPVLARALDSVAGIGCEVIVLDTGSSDRTVTIAREKGATVAFFTWTGSFAEARNRVIALATGDWILSLDADEAVTKEFREGWAEIARSSSADGLALPIENRGSGETELVAPVVRLFRNRCGYSYEGSIHEDIGASIARAGRATAAAELPIVHYGYTREEDTRKGRRRRNLTMLEAERRANPTSPRIGHYLALEHVLGDEPAKAIPLLEQVLVEHPRHELTGWSASLLSQCLEMRGDPRGAWGAAERASGLASGKVMGLLRMGRIALAEGDPETPAICADQLMALEGAVVDVEQRRTGALHLRAGALWVKGERELALAQWLEAVRSFPNDGVLADQYVRHLATHRGGVRGALEAMRLVPTLVVAASAVGSFVRAGDWGRAGQLAASCPAQTLYTAHAFLRTGRIEEGLEVFKQQGPRGALGLVLWALERGDDDLLARALDGAPESWSAVALAVARGERPPPALDCLLWQWAGGWFEMRGDTLAARMIDLGLESDLERAGRLCVMLFELERHAEALEWAGRYPEALGAWEVSGLLAYHLGDWKVAADRLARRARAGDAPVRVYHLGAQALLRCGRDEEARQVLALGRRARPHSSAFAGAPGS
jgi:tetratricopeptide (TPR) repeat protein